MIPLNKLGELPRHLKIRKSARIFDEAEQRLIISGCLKAGEAEYLCGLAELLSCDKGFSEAEAAALKSSKAKLSQGACKNEGELRRALNTINYLLLAETGRNRADWDFTVSQGALDASKRRFFQGMQVYLEDIRSPFNVGSMFRSAESFGAEKLWLSPLCADPGHKRAERSAMGCIGILPWERLSSDPFGEKNNGETPSNTFAKGPFFTMETGGTALQDFIFPLKGILIVGSEELGVSPKSLEAADSSLGRVSIPTLGAKGSLNVSVAFGIVMQAWAAKLIRD